jgi:hypothetical protein
MEIPFNFTSELAEPIGEETPHIGQPPAAEDSEEYLCGNAGNAHPYANPGRDQDRNRADECSPAQPFARYVS